MFVEELNRDLTGRLLAIWTGQNEDGSPINLPLETQLRYREAWRRNPSVLDPKPVAPARTGRVGPRRPGGCGCGGKN